MTRLRRRALLAALAAAPTLTPRRGLGAAPGDATPPPPGTPRPLALPALHPYRLDNGLELIVAPRHGMPLVTATLVLRAGADVDPPGRAGLAAAVAALLARGARRGTQAVGAGDLARQAEALGGTLDIDSGWRLTRVSMTVSTPRLPAALALLGDVVRRPLFADEEFRRWRLQALDELQLARSDPSAVAMHLARRLYWGPGAYGAVVTANALWQLTPADLRAFHHRMARPDRALLVLAGDVTPGDATALAERVLAAWPRPADAPPADLAATAAPLPVRQLLVDMPGAGQSSVLLAAPWAGLGDPDLRAAQVASAVLGGGYSSRLNQQVRIRRGLSYGVFGDGEAFPGGGWWTASAQTDHANASTVLRLLRDEVQRLVDEAPPPDELAARQAALVGSFVRRWDTNAGIAGTLAAHWATGRPWAALATYPDEVTAVSGAQVRDAARRHWRAEQLRTVVVGDLRAAGAGLDAAMEPAWRLPMGDIDFDQPMLTAGRR